MKISPLPSGENMAGGVIASNDPQASRVQGLRALKMMTNATPGHELPPEAEQNLSIPDPSEPTNAAEVTKQPLSPQYAALAKQKRALQVKEREIADREKALSTAATQADAIDRARLKSDPLGVLLESGVTYDQLTQAILSNQDGVSPKFQAMEAKIKALEEGVDKKLSERDQQAEQQVLSEMRREATLLASEGETFALVRETRSVPDVVRLIERTYRETGEVLDVREAMELVEAELVEESLKLARLQKVQSQIAPPAPQPPEKRPMRTLTNRDTAQAPMSPKARALAAFRGTLKQ